MFDRILVPLDGSMLAERAILHAEMFAHIFGSSIILLQILDPTSYHENPESVDPLSWQIRKTEADLYMSGIAARIRKNSLENSKDKGKDGKGATVEYTIREGKPAENIVNFAHTENIDLLIISTHGSSGLSRWNISSITQKVLNLIYLPVLIVRAYNQPESGIEKIQYHHILLPIDSSRRAECSLSAGIALARRDTPEQVNSKGTDGSSHQITPEDLPLQSKLILAAVIRPPEIPIPEPYPVEIEKLSENLMQVSRQAVSAYLEEMKDRLPVDCEVRVVESNSVSSAIQKLANHEKEIDLVVLCAHGHTGEPAWPYGSVTRNYIEHGTKTVLVIQDIHRSQVRPTAAEVSSENTGGR
jgi:nucleotide-binding universal stress UspA family protein